VYSGQFQRLAKKQAPDLRQGTHGRNGLAAHRGAIQFKAFPRRPSGMRDDVRTDL
jgi:hypothetical protein